MLKFQNECIGQIIVKLSYLMDMIAIMAALNSNAMQLLKHDKF